MNARFWHWHTAGWVKLTLRKGQTLTHSQGGPTDEGYSRETTTWSFDGEYVYCELSSDARDCDGPHSTSCRSCCLPRDLKVRDMHADEQARAILWGDDPTQPQFNENVGVFAPEWLKLESCQFDAFAESMNY